METKCMLTTFDNPFSPFDEFSSWYDFDKQKGYNCCERVARIARFADEFTDQENDEENERAIDEIIQYDILNIYKKVKKEVKSS